MSSDGQACACLRVVYHPIENDDGSATERWACVLCGTAFVKRVAAEFALREAALVVGAALSEIRELTAPDDPCGCNKTPPLCVPCRMVHVLARSGGAR